MFKIDMLSLDICHEDWQECVRSSPACIDHAACLYCPSPSPLPCSQERLPARADKKITTPWDREDRPLA